ncbi:MAG: ATP-binding protein [Candidatus Enterenecus sp.]
MTKRIFRSTLLVAVVVLLASMAIILGILYDYFTGVREQQLRNELDLAAAAVEESGTGYLERLSSNQYRLTWVAADGAVLYDTQADAQAMESHADREEIQEALAKGEGESSRYSSTLTEKTIYYARLLADGTVLRISVQQVTAVTLLLGILQPVLVVAVVAIILSALLANRAARRIVEPLNRLDLDHPMDNDVYEELSPLVRRLEAQRGQIDEQMRDLEQRTREFEQITGSMNEGLVLLDRRGMILSINPAARTLFGTDSSCVGRDFLTVDRAPELDRAIRAAMAEGHKEIRCQRGGREYQFDISPIQGEGQAAGAVLLTFDVTEQAFAERNRREFTANVSHELKTPLQSIIGSAELLENGLVKEEDVPRFVGHIRQEAARLVTLVEDIIRLSQLDEGDEMPREDVELLALAGEAAASLEEAARAAGVTIAVEGEETHVSGVRRLLSEVICNLCDNAVKYNVPGGSVTVTVSGDETSAVLSVKDTGIGIPPEHQGRVFERFYRVDKSHSKASGGTGLGLSIVKHAVQYHGGTLELQSQEGRGTTVTVRLPKA